VLFIIFILLIKFAWTNWIHPSWQLVYISPTGYAASYGEYSSSGACLDALHAGYYNQGECGKNCKLSPSGLTYYCKETVD